MDQYNLFQKLRTLVGRYQDPELLRQYEAATMVDCSSAALMAGDLITLDGVGEWGDAEHQKACSQPITKQKPYRFVYALPKTELDDFQNQRLPWDSAIFTFSLRGMVSESLVFQSAVPGHPLLKFYAAVCEVTPMFTHIRAMLANFAATQKSIRLRAAEHFLSCAWSEEVSGEGGLLAVKPLLDPVWNIRYSEGTQIWEEVEDGSKTDVLPVIAAQLQYWCRYALELVHCKNVGVCGATELGNRGERRQRDRVFGKRIYKVLDLSRVSRSSGSLAPGSGEPRAFHLCRGHFRTYTADAPLFGRVIGRVWVPPHTRGSREIGIVEKDYSLGTP